MKNARWMILPILTIIIVITGCSNNMKVGTRFEMHLEKLDSLHCIVDANEFFSDAKTYFHESYSQLEILGIQENGHIVLSRTVSGACGHDWIIPIPYDMVKNALVRYETLHPNCTSCGR